MYEDQPCFEFSPTLEGARTVRSALQVRVPCLHIGALLMEGKDTGSVIRLKSIIDDVGRKI